MLRDPFSVLGVPPSASPAQVRAAYRRLALRHHPDLNPGDRFAARRFKRVLSAYRSIAGGRRGPAEPASPPPAPRPDRFGCASCGDTFPFPESCPRCGEPLFDRSAGPPPARRRPEVERMIEALLSRPEEGPGWEAHLPVPAILVSACVLFGAISWGIGPKGPALLFLAFGAYVAGVEAHRRLRALELG